MLALLASHAVIFAPLGAAVAIAVGVGLIGGWPLLLNRWVLGGFALLVGATAAALWWAHVADGLRAEGAAHLQQVNERATAARREAISEYVVAQAERTTAEYTQRRLAEQRLDLERDARAKERKSQYAKADAACVVPLRFVRDHDAALPRPVGRAAVPEPSPGGGDDGSGLGLSDVAQAIDNNYTACAKLLGRVESAERKRRADCEAWDAKYGTRSGCR